MSYQQFCRFLATFYSASKMCSYASRLLDDERYDSKDLMTKQDYHRTLKLIEKSSMGDDDDSLWMQLEEKFNTFTKKDFIAHREDEDLSIALDDDKKHFAYSKHSNTRGLKNVVTYGIINLVIPHIPLVLVLAVFLLLPSLREKKKLQHKCTLYL